MEPTEDEMIIRYRIDGLLTPGKSMDREQGDAVLNIFKVLANLDITEKRKAQDGSFSAEVQAEADPLGRRPTAKDNDEEDGPPEVLELQTDKPKLVTRQIDFRVATAGSVVGEKMVMRLLDRSRQVKDLAQLGMRPKLREQIRSIVQQPHGLFLVCGPTGSGKSTTLCACLFQIDRYQKNVITVENPVEYHIDGVTQIEVNPKAGKTFASELRSILRQDPDVIYIGEIRDQETAEIACQAAQTGHMVFSTIHANDTVTAIGRLLELEVRPFVIASSLTAILGQRLVRTLCPKCKVAYRPNPELIKRLGVPPDKVKHFYRAPREDEYENPCKHCGNTGYRGRTGIFELLVVSDKMRDLIKAEPSPERLRAEAHRTGMVQLIQDGMRVVIEGETSIEEIQRVAK
jgi:general secretion pathway protein E